MSLHRKTFGLPTRAVSRHGAADYPDKKTLPQNERDRCSRQGTLVGNMRVCWQQGTHSRRAAGAARGIDCADFSWRRCDRLLAF